eukprot:5398905-Pleurochrysis_carterae.AAC.1
MRKRRAPRRGKQEAFKTRAEACEHLRRCERICVGRHTRAGEGGDRELSGARACAGKRARRSSALSPPSVAAAHSAQRESTRACIAASS